jgi:hypothetical protein
MGSKFQPYSHTPSLLTSAQCVPRPIADGSNLYNCMYCNVMLVDYVPNKKAKLWPTRQYYPPL